MNKITDGTGSNYSAKVDARFRLHTHAFDVPIDISAAIGGDLFNASSWTVVLDNDSESAIFYIENNSQEDLIVINQFLGTGPSLNGSGPFTLKFYINSTGGDISTAGTDVVAFNRRLASAEVLEAVIKSGAQGRTITGGTVSEVQLLEGFENAFPIVIPPGVNLGISIAPPAGNTEFSVNFGLFLINNAPAYGS